MRKRIKGLWGLHGLGLALAITAPTTAAGCGETSREDHGAGAGGAAAGTSAVGGSAGASATGGHGGLSAGAGGTSNAHPGGAGTAGSHVGAGARSDAGGGSTGGKPGQQGGVAGDSASVGGATESGDAGSAGANPAGGEGGASAGLCSGALPLQCGDRWDHDTLVEGRANQWLAYGRTARAESGRETIYAFDTPRNCSVVANLKNLTTDLDLLLLSSCNPFANVEASSTPLDLQTVETVSWTNPAGETVFVVVDGYGGEQGSYTLEVDCTCDGP